MGLHDRIKASLAATSKEPPNTEDHPEANTPAKREKNKPAKGSGNSPASRRSEQASNKGRRPAKTGIPPFKEPPIPKGHRALLVACSQTGRASWAVLKEDRASGSYSFVRNLRAAPDPKAMKDKAPSKQPTTPETGSSHRPGELPMEKLDLAGFTCGVCGADGSTGSLIVRCGSCGTLQCRPSGAWHCPGCGAYIEQISSTIDSLASTEGSSYEPPARGGLSAGPSREAITSAAPATTDNTTRKKRRKN